MIQVGSEVGWLWSGSLVIGKIIEIHPSRHEIISQVLPLSYIAGQSIRYIYNASSDYLSKCSF